MLVAPAVVLPLCHNSGPCEHCGLSCPGLSSPLTSVLPLGEGPPGQLSQDVLTQRHPPLPVVAGPGRSLQSQLLSGPQRAPEQAHRRLSHLALLVLQG